MSGTNEAATTVSDGPWTIAVHIYPCVKLNAEFVPYTKSLDLSASFIGKKSK